MMVQAGIYGSLYFQKYCQAAAYVTRNDFTPRLLVAAELTGPE